MTREDTRHVLAVAGADEGPIETIPDVLLDVPTVKVDEISLDVERLHARVALHAELANLVKLDVGAEVDIDRVALTIKGVEAQALLKVRLQRVYEILNRALQTVDNNPELLASLLRPVGHAISEVGEATHETLRPGGAISEAVHDVGDVAKGATGPGGALTRVLGDVGGTVKGTLAPGGAVDETLKGTLGQDGVVAGAGRTLDRALQDGKQRPSKRKTPRHKRGPSSGAKKKRVANKARQPKR
ncbi:MULTISPECIES: hypothetical protein [unclassified Myxococcus]|uniref:hypothetical protein n=1 Tax=unclassified Myxococcus TaxID=2648731 RepID=UPI0020C6D0B6|nr:MULTISPECIES: hypothetical protein [unclassified Myxococcus]